MIASDANIIQSIYKSIDDKYGVTDENRLFINVSNIPYRGQYKRIIKKTFMFDAFRLAGLNKEPMIDINSREWIEYVERRYNKSYEEIEPMNFKRIMKLVSNGILVIKIESFKEYKLTISIIKGILNKLIYNLKQPNPIIQSGLGVSQLMGTIINDSYEAILGFRMISSFDNSDFYLFLDNMNSEELGGNQSTQECLDYLLSILFGEESELDECDTGCDSCDIRFECSGIECEENNFECDTCEYDCPIKNIDDFIYDSDYDERYVDDWEDDEEKADDDCWPTIIYDDEGKVIFDDDQFD